MIEARSPIEIGWIPYLNLVPFYCELRRLTGDSIKFASGHPSVVSRWLTEGRVHLAPASSISLIKADNLRIPFPLGIASEGPVYSVYIGLHPEHAAFWNYVRSRQSALADFFHHKLQRMDLQDLVQSSGRDGSSMASFADVPELLLTPASAASAALTEILLHIWCGRDRAFKILSSAKNNASKAMTNRVVGSRPMELVIGDEALRRRHEFWKVLDLGQVWNELTRLPFVFGLWQSSYAHLPAKLFEAINEAAAIAQARMQIEPDVYFPEIAPLADDGSLIDLKTYWSAIQYKLTKRHLKSLTVYFNLYKQISDHDDGSFSRKMMSLNGENFASIL